MTQIKPKKLKSFFNQKEELRIIDQIFESPDLIFEKFEDLKIAITNLQITAREYRKAWKYNDLRDEFYARQKYEEVNNLNRCICFYKEFKDLINMNKLETIELVAKKIANKFLKEYRKSGSEIDKKEISNFRSLEQQIKRLKETLEKQIRILQDYSEISKRYKPVIKSTVSAWREYYKFEIKRISKSDLYFVRWKEENKDYLKKMEDLEISALEDKLERKHEKVQSKLRGPGRPRKSNCLVNWIQTA